MNDGSLNSQESFEVAFLPLDEVPVTAIPVIAPIANQAVLEDTPITIAVTVSDADTDPALLTVAGHSDNPALVPAGNISFSGSGASRTLTIVPATNEFGTARIFLTVSDGVNQGRGNFLLTVNPVNDFPTVDPLPDIAMDSREADRLVSVTGITAGAPNEYSTLNFTATSSVPAMVQTKNFHYTSPQSYADFKINPADKALGIYPITLVVWENSPASNNLVLQSFDLYVRDRNNSAPTIALLPNQIIAEDTSTGPIPFTVGDTESAANTLICTGKSSNPALVPNGNIVFGGSGASRTVTVTPLPHQFGRATITVLVVDPGFGMTSTTFLLTVTPVNSAPFISNLVDRTVMENEATATLPFTVGDTETSADRLVVSATSSNPTLVPAANIQLGGTGASRALRVQPVSQQSGSATITVTVSDGVATAQDSFVLTVTPVEDAPAISSIADQTTDEDTPTAPIAFVVSDFETPAANLALSAFSSDAGLVPAANIVFGGSGSSRTVTVTPAPDQSGNVQLTITVTDEDGMSASSSFVLTVNPINDPPTLDPLADLELNVGAGEQTIALTGISSGGASEAQILTVAVVSSNPSLTSPPTVEYAPGDTSGTLRFTPAPDAEGTAVLTVTVNDGQAANHSISQIFSVTISQLVAISDVGNQVMDEDAIGTIPFTVNNGMGNPDDLTVTAVASNPNLLAATQIVLGGSGADRTLTLAPAHNQYGYTTLTLTATDLNGYSASRSFLLLVNPLNDAPTLDPIPDLGLAEDAGQQIVQLTGIGSGASNENQPLVVRAVSSNPALVPHPTVNYTSPNAFGFLTFVPAADVTGTATITVTVNDLQSQNNLTAVQFEVTVTGENDPPVISEIVDQVTSEDTVKVVAFNVHDSDNAATDLTVAAVSVNTELVPNANLTITGTDANRFLQITPAPNQTGTAAIAVTVTDPAGATASAQFNLTVEANGDLPVISAIPDQTIAEDAVAGPLDFTVSDVETATENLVLTGHSLNPRLVPDENIVFGGVGGSRTVTVTPAADESGSTLITVTVTDESGSAASSSFLLTVSPVNDPPTIEGPTDQTMDEDTTAVVEFTVNDSETPAEVLLVTVTSSNPSLVPEPQLVLGGTGALRTVSISPLPDQFGSATITLTVKDAAGTTAQASFALTVNNRSDLPLIVTQPQAQTTTLGGTATFTVTATGAANLQYQWRHQGVELPGQTAATLVLNNVQAGDAGEYSVIVTSVEGSVTSDSAQLLILVRPELVQITHAANTTQVSFTTETGHAYTVEYTTSLTNPVWTPLSSGVASSQLMSVTDPEAVETTRFYRVRAD